MKTKQLLSVAVIAAFFAVAFLGGCAKDDTPKSIFMMGLWWDKENSADCVTFDEANALAAKAGKRLPTKAEFQQLCQLPQRWDYELKGKWFAERKEDLGNPEKALFLPALGMYNPTGEFFYHEVNHGYLGYYWSSTQDKNGYVYNLSFLSTGSYPNDGYSKKYGFSVRCVAK